MNNKIKEILDFKEDADYKKLSIEDILLLKEYIEKLEKKVELYQDTTTFGDYVGTINNLIELQDRIDKAIKFIKNTKVVSYEQDEVYLFKDIPEGYDLLNILQGDDK